MVMRKFWTSSFVDTQEAAKFLGLSAGWLEVLRMRGGGPEYYKLGRRVSYAIRDLENWAEARRHKTTRCAGRG
jgi:hypothetical protein